MNKEKDDIYSLLAYAIVYADWQEDDLKGRGYNVGAILVDSHDEIVTFGLNAVNRFHNSTKHGEILLMTNYLQQSDNFNLEGHTMYSTLEPCAMCAGMMIMTSLKRIVIGQNDLYYSKALERFSIDTSAYGGYPPYPRTVVAELTPSLIAEKLDQAYKAYVAEGNKAIITKFLSTDRAKEIYQEAQDRLLQYQVIHTENIALYRKAVDYLKHVKSNPKSFY